MFLLKYNGFDEAKNSFLSGFAVKNPYIVSTTIPVTDYTDITNIVNWKNKGEKLLGSFFGWREWKKLRSEVGGLSSPAILAGTTQTTLRNYDEWTVAQQNTAKTNFQTFTAEQQQIIADLFIVPIDLQLLVTNVLDVWVAKGLSTFHPFSVQSRQKRFSVAFSQVRARLKLKDALSVQRDLRQIAAGTLVQIDVANQLVNALRGLEMVGSYVTEGIEGTVEEQDTQAYGIFDYLLGRTGTPFDGKGFKQKTFTVKGMVNMAELGDAIFDIMKNGNY